MLNHKPAAISNDSCPEATGNSTNSIRVVIVSLVLVLAPAHANNDPTARSQFLCRRVECHIFTLDIASNPILYKKIQANCFSASHLSVY